MVQDDLKNFVQCLYKYLVAQDQYVPGLLVKKHSNNLQAQGDFSFPNTAKSWQEFLNCEQLNLNDTLLKCVKKDVIDLINSSRDWPIPVVKAIELKDRVHLFLDRCNTIRIAFNSSIYNIDIISQRIDKDTLAVKLDSLYGDSNCITFLRLKYLMQAVRNLYLINIYPQEVDVIVTWKSGYEKCDIKSVLCGTVLNAQTGTKENNVTALEYIRLRQDELTLIAQHKYGVRVSIDAKWKEFIAHLGESAVAFELLQTKCSSPVKIHFDASGGSSKGAAFILYNCARLETIIRTFNEKVLEGVYPPLPILKSTDLSLLSDEDEWCLIFNFIMGLPSLLTTSVELTEEKCEFRPHLICNYLSGMVKVFSQYYRRVRILTEPRKHLLPVMCARIHMLIILNNTLKLCLTILNIKSVTQMYNVYFFPLILSYYVTILVDYIELCMTKR